MRNVFFLFEFFLRVLLESAPALGLVVLNLNHWRLLDLHGQSSNDNLRIGFNHTFLGDFLTALVQVDELQLVLLLLPDLVSLEFELLAVDQEIIEHLSIAHAITLKLISLKL